MPQLSGLFGDPWRYELTPGDVWRPVTTPRDRERRLVYPGYGTLRLFTVSELAQLLRAEGLDLRRVWGILSITNVPASTVRHRPRLGRPLAAANRILCGADRALCARCPAARLTNSLVVLGRRGSDSAIGARTTSASSNPFCEE